MPKHTALKLHTTTSAVGLQLNCRHNSKLKFNVVSTCRNHTDHCQKSVGHVQMRMAMWNLVHLQCIEIILSLSTQRLFVCARSKDKAPDKAVQLSPVILAILLKINIWIFLIAGNVGSGWQLCMLRNFHWTFSLKWLYLKSELTMLHTCFLMTIYSTCTRCILTEFSFIYGVV